MKKSTYTRAIIHQFDPEVPSPGGTDTCIRDMLKFIPEGERVLVIGVSEHRRLNRLVRIETFPTPFDFLPVSRATPRNQSRLVPHSIRVLFGLARAFLTHRLRADVVQIHRLEPGLLVSSLRPRRVAYFVHTNIKQALSGNSDSFWRKAPNIYGKLERRVLDRSDIVVVFNQITSDVYASRGHNVERMRTWYNENVYYLPTGEPAPAPEQKTLLWVGRIEAPKDPLFAVQVVRALREQAPETWRFSLIGHGTMRSQVEQHVQDLGLEDVVTLHGAVSREEVSEHMREADVLLMTSHFEGSPRVLYEGMGSGLPVVATNEADPDHVIVDGENGFVLTQKSAERFASAILNAEKLERTEVADTVAARQASSVLSRLWALTSG